MYAHCHFSSCCTLLWAAWLCIPGHILMGTRRPCLGPSELSLLQDKSRSLSLYSVRQVTQPLTILVGLHWTCPIWSMSFLYQVAQNWPQYSRCHLRSAEKRGMITTLDVLAMLLLIELRMLLALLAAQTHSRLTAEMHPTWASAVCISARSKQSALLLYWWPCFWIRNPELSPEFSWQLQTCYLPAEKNYTYRHLKCAVFFNLMLGTT